MFYFLVILSCVAIGSYAAEKLPDSIRGTILDAATKCVSEYNLSPDILPQMTPSDFGKNEVLQKVAYCGVIASGLGDESGHFKTEKTAQFFPKDVQAVIEECNKEEGNDPIATVAKIMACVDAKSPVLYSFA